MKPINYPAEDRAHTLSLYTMQYIILRFIPLFSISCSIYLFQKR